MKLYTVRACVRACVCVSWSGSKLKRVNLEKVSRRQQKYEQLPSMQKGVKRQEKMHLKMSSADVICCKKKLSNIINELSIKAKRVDPEQTAPIGAV